MGVTAIWNDDGAVGTVTGYWMEGARCPGSSPGRVKSVLSPTSSKISGVHPASYSNRQRGGSFPRVERPEHEADHSPPTSAEVKKT
jgi:hypothetical protein